MVWTGSVVKWWWWGAGWLANLCQAFRIDKAGKSEAHASRCNGSSVIIPGQDDLPASNSLNPFTNAQATHHGTCQQRQSQ